MSGWQDNDAVTITYRTLRQAQAEAAADEQERIIKLAEEWLASWEQHQEPCEALIALIKGKN